MLKTIENVAICDFCGKNQFEVLNMVAADRCHICDKCARLAVSVVDADPSKEAPIPVADNAGLLSAIRDTEQKASPRCS